MLARAGTNEEDVHLFVRRLDDAPHDQRERDREHRRRHDLGGAQAEASRLLGDVLD